MKSIEIEIDEFREKFVLAGAISELIDIKRAKLYLTDYLNAEFNEGKVYIPYDNQNQSEVLTKIRKLLKKHRFEEEKSDQVKIALQGYFKEEENFEKFSSKANNIRNKIFDKWEFNTFVSYVKANMKNRTLYELQLLSAFHLAFAQNACNFSVPGAGKTSIVYGAYAYLKHLKNENPKKVNRLLIIGPLSSFGPWESEFEECFGYKPYSKRLSGGVDKAEKTNYFYSDTPAEITLISYQGLPSVKDDLVYFLKKEKVMVVLDEAHKIKNTDGGIIAETTLELAKYCKSRVILTGTPAPNGYEDMLNLFNFIWPTKNVIKYKKYHLQEMSESYSDERIPNLINNIAPFFIRIKKSDLGIPKPIENPPIMVEMDSHQRKIYDFIEDKYMNYLVQEDDTPNLKSFLVRARLIRLMQAATNPGLLKQPIQDFYEDDTLTENYIDDTEILEEIYDYSDSIIPNKFKKIGELVQSIVQKGEKVIIWMSFIQNMRDLKKYLDTINIQSRLLYGEVPVESEQIDKEVETREKIIKEFHNQKSEFAVLIANPYAVSESISLHKVCHNAIYAERNFNAAQFIQSKDRIHRYGLKSYDKINYYYFLSSKSIDETIHERLEFKEKRMMEVMENQPIPLFSLIEDEYEEDDIKVLIRNYTRKVN
ncbi:DEAD/DEAH box helicase [Sediminibacillus sp. JSM 1682029]|uniref:DEAD/DEAH box helicase n=1 Tax=Sediminibacillus sp. JSM 1682029 TaxID=3229857 RepID=UPI003525A010